MPRLPLPLAPPFLTALWVVASHALGLVSPAAVQALRPWSGSGVGSPLASLLVGGPCCCLLWGRGAYGIQSCLPSLVGMEVPCRPDQTRTGPSSSQGVFSASAFQGLSPKRTDHGLPAGSSEGLPGAGCLFPLTKPPGLPRTRPVCPQKEALCWVGEVICFAWSFSKSRLGLVSRTQAESKAEALLGWWTSHPPGAAGLRGQAHSPPPRSHQPVLCGAERVHVGGAGRGDAAADGAEPPAHAAHEDRHPVPDHVPPPGGLRHEHPVPPHHETGNLPLTVQAPGSGPRAAGHCRQIGGRAPASPGCLPPTPSRESG